MFMWVILLTSTFFALSNSQILKGKCATTTVNLRSDACGDIIDQASEDEFFEPTGNTKNDCDSYNWMEFSNGLWAADAFFRDCVEIVNICAKSDDIYLQNAPCESSTTTVTTVGAKYRATGNFQTSCDHDWIEIRDFEGDLFWTHSPTSNTFEKCYSKVITYFTIEQLMQTQPGLSEENANIYLPHFNAAIAEGEITTCDRLSAFSAQIGHESGSLRYWEELADGSAYEGRESLCNTVPGDGPRFKGRGPIQLTGRCNYRDAGTALGLDLLTNYESVATPSVGFRTTIWYWNSRKLNNWADMADRVGFDQVTYRINGGYNGKAERDSRYLEARDVLGCDGVDGYVLESELPYVWDPLVLFLSVGVPLTIVFGLILMGIILMIVTILLGLRIRDWKRGGSTK